MLDDGIPFLGPKIDLHQVKPITPRRTLAFINFFILQTTNFLNKFATICDEKLNDVGLRIERMETLLLILETKISSIPGLESVSIETQQAVDDEPPKAVETNAATTTTTTGNEVDVAADDNTKESVGVVAKITNRNNPLYKKYFTMLSMGIPAAAVKQKMTMEGIDPRVLDNPTEASEGTPPPTEDDVRDSKESDSSDDSDSSFCD